jgi:hypothetical protein
VTFSLTSSDEIRERGTFPECRAELIRYLTRRGQDAAAARVSWWQEDAPPTPDPRGAFWSIVAGGTLYEIHNQGARWSWLDPDVFGPATHVLTLDDVVVHRGTFPACALTMSSRFTGHSLEILARLDPTAAELADWDDRHGDPMKAPWLERRLTDDEWSDLRRFRNCAKFAERLEEPGADAQVVSLALEAGGMTYRLSPIGDEQ